MYKLTKHFKLSKETKRMLAHISDAHLRGEILRAFAQAQFGAAQIKPRGKEVPTRDPVTGMLVTD